MNRNPNRDWQRHVVDSILPRMEHELERATALPAATADDFIPQRQTNFAPSDIRIDPLLHLPPAAADRLRALREHAADMNAMCVTFEELREANLARQTAAARLKQLLAHPQDDGFNLPADNRSVLQAERDLARVTDDLARLNERNKLRTSAWHAAGSVVAAVESWIRGGIPGNVAFEPVEVEAPRLAKNETVLDAIEKLRRRVGELQTDLRRIRSAPFPANHCKARMREQVETLARRGSVNVGALLLHDGDLQFPALSSRALVHNAGPGAVAFAETPDAVALFAWLHRDLLIKRLDAAIDAEADDATALSVEARQQAEAEVQLDLLEVERSECALVWLAQSQNLPLEFRADTNPLALLSVQLVTAPRATALPPTSPGLVIDVLTLGGR